MYYILNKIERDGKIIGVTVDNGGVETFVPKNKFGMLVHGGVYNASITKDGKVVSNGKSVIGIKKYSEIGKIDVSKLQNNEDGIILYHGSQKVVSKPVFGKGVKANDYGLGFYCTQNYQLACEWSCKEYDGGVVNAYRLDVEGLKILNLGYKSNEGILKWVAILLENRVFDDSRKYALIAKKYLKDKHLIKDYRQYDVIIGYRADDSYFSYVSDFISGNDTLEGLSRALKLGNLGIQVVPISKKAIERLKYLGYSEAPKGSHAKFEARDIAARKAYFDSGIIGSTTIVKILEKEGYLSNV